MECVEPGSDGSAVDANTLCGMAASVVMLTGNIGDVLVCSTVSTEGADTAVVEDMCCSHVSVNCSGTCAFGCAAVHYDYNE